MAKNHPGRQFMLGAMIGSTVGALSAMMLTSKKGHSMQKHAMEKFHEIEKYVKQLVHGSKRKVEKTMKTIHRAVKIKNIQKVVKRKKSKKR